MHISQPLADRIRPQTLEEYFGQEHLVGQGTIMRQMIEQDRIPSMIFWGPPGSGKTTLARIIAKTTQAEFKQLSAIDSGVKDIRAVVEDARAMGRLGSRMIVFIDEIHRYNKAQQDALLPVVEDGTITLIGATTENPSFEINSALLSRTRVFVLEMLSVENLNAIIDRALHDEAAGLALLSPVLEDDARDFLTHIAQGDARTALNALELAVQSQTPNKKGERVISREVIKEAVQRTNVIFDKKGEEFYNLISALHKSMRGGNPDASLYWLGRMLEGGADPLYIARRIIRFASEDIGIANSLALPQAVAAFQACQYVGMPECGVNLAQAVVYMAQSKKSVALYKGYKKVQKDVHEQQNAGVPLHLRNASTQLMKDLEYGKGYKYTPDFDEGAGAQDYLPEELKGRKYLE
jgi:putative ATPase